MLVVKFFMEFIEIEFASQLYKDELALRNSILRQPLGLDIYDEDLEAEKSAWHFGILQLEQLIACLVITRLSKTHVSAGQMAVSDTLQGAGVGRLLVNEVEAVLMTRAIKHIELSARVTAAGFYSKLGYDISGKTFLKVSIPHIKMIKTL